MLDGVNPSCYESAWESVVLNTSHGPAPPPLECLGRASECRPPYLGRLMPSTCRTSASADTQAPSSSRASRVAESKRRKMEDELSPHGAQGASRCALRARRGLNKYSSSKQQRGRDGLPSRLARGQLGNMGMGWDGYLHTWCTISYFYASTPVAARRASSTSDCCTGSLAPPRREHSGGVRLVGSQAR